MSLQTLDDRAEETWQAIMVASADDRTGLYWQWCQIVTGAQRDDELTIQDAASLLIWPAALDNLHGLGDVAEIMIVLDAADSIAEGCAYFESLEREKQEWALLAARVNRHVP